MHDSSPDGLCGRIPDLDYAALGLRCGLEVHQQILTSRKLFCHCPAGKYSEEVDAEVLRHLRPTLSELGEFDPCALMEFKKNKELVYLLNKDSACTYETDDTPPFPINAEAVETALEVALLLDCQIVGEAHVIRKQYLDGSIPTGFQRTMVLGVKGRLKGTPLYPPVNGGRPARCIRVLQVGLEEDACREVSDVGHTITFRTDRMGIPLVEVVTAPDMTEPYEVAEIARLIAQTLRLTGKVRRGIGSVRQDVNISIAGGARVEIKGVPRIPVLPRLVSIEAYRQRRLLELRDLLRARGITTESLEYSVTELPAEKIHFHTAQLVEAHTRHRRVTAVRVKGIAGILQEEIQPQGRTFAHELSGRVRVIACLDGSPNLLHTDARGEFALTAGEEIAVRALTGAGESDVVIVTWGPDADVETAITEIITRIREATVGVPGETRQARPGGCTVFERLLSGPDTMYPDTDSPPVIIAREHVEQLRRQLPDPPWTRLDKLTQAGVSRSLAEQLLLSPLYGLFWKLIEEFTLPANRVARVLVQDVCFARRIGGHPERISEKAWRELFEHLRDGELQWEAVPRLVQARARRPGAPWLALASRQRMLPVGAEEWMPLLTSLMQTPLRTPHRAARIRWIMGQLQRPPGRVPVKRILELLEGTA